MGHRVSPTGSFRGFTPRKVRVQGTAEPPQRACTMHGWVLWRPLVLHWPSHVPSIVDTLTYRPVVHSPRPLLHNSPVPSCTTAPSPPARPQPDGCSMQPSRRTLRVAGHWARHALSGPARPCVTCVLNAYLPIGVMRSSVGNPAIVGQLSQQVQGIDPPHHESLSVTESLEGRSRSGCCV